MRKADLARVAPSARAEIGVSLCGFQFWPWPYWRLAQREKTAEAGDGLAGGPLRIAASLSY